jgi:hypothetical protein
MVEWVGRMVTNPPTPHLSAKAVSDLARAGKGQAVVKGQEIVKKVLFGLS